MTVGQLITELQKHDPNMVAVVNLSKNEGANGAPVQQIRVVPAMRWRGARVNWNEDYYPTVEQDEDYEYKQVVDITA